MEFSELKKLARIAQRLNLAASTTFSFNGN